jgi:hypothetical protein
VRSFNLHAAEPGATQLLMLSMIPSPGISIAVYPDSDKVSVWPPGKRLRMSDSLDYWDGEA